MFDLNVNGTVVVGYSTSKVVGDRKVHELSVAIKYHSKGNEVTEWIPAKYWTRAGSKLVIPKGTTLRITGDLRTSTWKREDGTTAKEVYVSIKKLDVIKWGKPEEPKPEEPKVQLLDQHGQALVAI
ncbi:MAG: single-stranded DNA-binding protein [Cyanobacteria bacterium P01_A01_bin.84]